MRDQPKKPERAYSFVGPEGFRPPDYERVVRGLSDAELVSELAAGRGDAGYQATVRAEVERRTEAAA